MTEGTGSNHRFHAEERLQIMSLCYLRMAIYLTVGAALAGCNQATPPKVNLKAVPDELTAEQAKTALSDLLRTHRFPYLEDDYVEQIAMTPVKVYDRETASWGTFRFDLKAQTYSYSISRYADEKKGYHAEFGGGFDLKEGAWIAKPPRVLSET